MTNTCFLKYEERCTGGDPESDEPYCSRSDEHIDFLPIGIYTTRKRAGTRFPETIQIGFKPEVGKSCFLVVVRYRTGDSFGISYGNWSVIGVFENAEDADAVKSAIEMTDDGETNAYECDVPTPNDEARFCNWNGYFETLEDVQIEPFQMS